MGNILSSPSMFGHNYPHKIFDPIHNFIRFNDLEKQVIDSPFYQRLRYIRQMGVAYLLYPGATHTRFEHSLGVMELVSHMYDAIATSCQLSQDELLYWRQVLRLAALCHDMGHLPFSHTAEEAVLPQGHESKTIEIIESSALSALWGQLGPNATADIVKLAVGRGTLTPWEKVLAGLITEDNFGADRIDYLIRDARYTGVGYGHFDTHQLIDSLRLVNDTTFCVHKSGLQSVEALWIARYLMYERVYHHRKARVYTHHMSRFIHNYFKRNGFPDSLEGYLRLADYSILAELYPEARSGDYDARALLHEIPPYKEMYVPKTADLKKIKAEFQEGVFIDGLHNKGKKERDFCVMEYDNSIHPAKEVSPFLRDIPVGGHAVCVYARPDLAGRVKEKF